MKNNENNEFVPFFLPCIDSKEEQAVLEVMRSGWLTTGKVATQFENDFAKKVGSKYALAVNSATNGLILAMEACGIKKGNNVITTPYTFVSTATTAMHMGAKVYYCDIEKDSYGIDPEKIEKILVKDKSIKAIVPVHIAGNPCNMEKICNFAKKYGVYVIEDCAHAFPSRTAKGYCGTLGDIGIFSFYVTKTMTTAEGGMIVTNDEQLYNRMKMMRLHGIDRNVWDRYTSSKASYEYDVIEAGYKYNLPDILAAIGVEQLKKCETFFEKRVKIVEKYNKAFKENELFILPPDSQGNSWHLYLLGLELSKLNCTRDEFALELQENNIGISMHFIPHFHFSLWKNCKSKIYDTKKPFEKFFNAQEHYQRTISLPLWPDMTSSMIEKVINTVMKIGKKYEKK